MVELHNANHLLKECQSLSLALIKSLSVDFIAELEKSFEHSINNATSNREHMDAFEDSRIFQKNKVPLRGNFYQRIENGFEQFKQKTLSTHVRENEFHNDVWSLVDEAILEETIAINTLSSRATVEYQDKLWQLNQRLTIVNGGNTVEESNNPISPVQFYVALRGSINQLPFNTKAKVVAYKSLGNVIEKHYEEIIDKVNNVLIAKGILPEIRYATTGNETQASDDYDEELSSDNNTSAPDTETKKTQKKSQIPLVNTIRNLLRKARHVDDDTSAIPIASRNNNHSSPDTGGDSTHESISKSSNGSGTTGVIFSNEQIIGAVESVQESAATAHFFSGQDDAEIIETPTDISQNSARIYNKLLEESPDGAINAQNMYTIDMVGMLFEYILSDESLPDSVKTLLSHLHTPFLKLAFLDSQFFEDENHKARLLLDSLAEAGANWVSHDGTAQYDMYNEIKRVVQRAVKEYKNDPNFFAELLMEFNLLKKRISHMHNLRERNSIEKKQGQEKHQKAKNIAREEIKKRIEGRRVPSSIISLLSPWFTYLTFIQLREGNESEQWTTALKVIDNLLMYCSIKQVKQDNQKLSDGFEQIIQFIESGLNAIAYDPSKATIITTELHELKENVLNKKEIKTTVTPSEKTSEKSSKNDPSENPDENEEKVMNYIKLIEIGTWIEHENKQRLKVNGYNSTIGKYVLVDQSSQDVTMITRLDFARDILSGAKRVVDGNAKSLFERALQRIHSNLDKQVQVASM